MFTTSQRKHSLAAPVEYRSLWTHDRDTWQPGGLAGMHRAFEHAFDAYEVLQTDLQTFERVDRRFDGVDGSLVDTKALLHRQRSGEFTRNGKPSLNPPYLAGNYRSGNLSASQSALGEGPAYSTFFTSTLAAVFHGLASKDGLHHLFGINFPRPIKNQHLKVGPTANAMVQYLHWNDLKLGIYDLRRANDSRYFAAVNAAEKIAERTGNDTAVKYARSRLERHLKLTDHSETIADTFYNQSGVDDQLIDFGTGLANAFAESQCLDKLFARPLSPKELANTVRLSHRGQGLRAIRQWVDQGLIPSPLGTCQWLRLLWSGFVAWLVALIPHKVGNAAAARR